MVLGFFFHYCSFTFHILFGLLCPFSIWTLYPFSIWTLHPFSIWIFFPIFFFLIFPIFIQFFFNYFFLFNRGHILDFFQIFLWPSHRDFTIILNSFHVETFISLISRCLSQTVGFHGNKRTKTLGHLGSRTLGYDS